MKRLQLLTDIIGDIELELEIGQLHSDEDDIQMGLVMAKGIVEAHKENLEYELNYEQN